MPGPKRGSGASAHRGFAVRDGDAALIAQLSPDHQAVLLATGGVAEIAAALSLAEGTVKSRLNRARSRLAKLRLVGG